MQHSSKLRSATYDPDLTSRIARHIQPATGAPRQSNGTEAITGANVVVRVIHDVDCSIRAGHIFNGLSRLRVEGHARNAVAIRGALVPAAMEGNVGGVAEGVELDVERCSVSREAELGLHAAGTRADGAAVAVEDGGADSDLGVHGGGQNGGVPYGMALDCGYKVSLC